MYKLQPIYELATRKLHAYELLYSGIGGADSVDCWNKLDSFMFENILPNIKFGFSERIRINVNLTSASAMLITDAQVKRISENFILAVEWSEKSFNNVDNAQVANKFKRWRQQYGVEVVLDDVCTDQCFLSKIALVRPDLIKLDGTVFKKSRFDPQYKIAADVAKHACALVNCPFLVEWIESEEELDFAINVMEAKYGQGFLMNKWEDSVKHQVFLPEFNQQLFNQYIHPETQEETERVLA